MPLRQEPEYRGFIAAEEIIHDLSHRRATNLDLIPAGETFFANYVIDGVITQEEKPNRPAIDSAIDYIKEVASLDVNDRRKPQNGNFSVKFDDGNIVNWRIDTSGSTRGEHLSLTRVEQAKSIKLDALGFSNSQLESINNAMKRKDGIILVSGPHGSGISTTLYAIIQTHDAFIQHIQTFEKQFLTELENITQNKLKDAPDTSKPDRQLLTIIRTDPDILLVGFCDSSDMALVGTQAAINGKKLYFALEAPSAFHALQIWLKMINNNDIAAKTLSLIINQRLLRRLCPHCRQAYTPDSKLLKKLNLPTEKIKAFYRPPAEPEFDRRGNPILCEKCQGTGYLGRIAAFEILVISDEIKNLIAQNTPINVIRTQSRKEKMLYLQEQALFHVINGTTSIHEILRITNDQKPKTAPQNTSLQKQNNEEIK